MTDELSMNFFRENLVKQYAERNGIDFFSLTDDEKFELYGKYCKELQEKVQLRAKQEEELYQSKLIENMERKRNAELESFISSIPELYANACIEDFSKSPQVVHELYCGNSGIILGPQGIGKTHMGWALARRWKEDNPLCTVCLRTAIEICDEIKGHIRDGMTDYIKSSYGKLDHLIIDEYDKSVGSQIDYSVFSFLVDYRYMHKRQTIIMGNGTKDSAQKLLGQSTWSRLSGDNASVYQLMGKDKRRKEQ